LRRPIGCLKLQVIFRKRATNYRALLQKMTCKNVAPHVSSPPCIFCNSSATHCRRRLTPTATHPVTYCKTLQRTATCTIRSTPQHTATRTISEMTTGITCPPLQHILQHTAIHCNSRDLDNYARYHLPPTATHTTHTATHCNTLLLARSR